MSNRPAIPAEIVREILLESGQRCAVCGTPCPLERAHIIPWHKSREHKAEDLICLCANCHERADKENWGEKTLREHKRMPWVLRQYENVARVPESGFRLEITICMDSSERFDDKNQRWLQYGIAAFLEIPPQAVKIVAIEQGSVKVTIELPARSANRLMIAYQEHDPELFICLAPLILLDLRRKATVDERRQALKQVKSLEQFGQTFQKNRNSLREEIESRASQLAQVSRHDFRHKTSELISFAQQFDTFSAEFEVLEEERRTFGARVPYIRGIAAHYSDQPEIARLYLEEAVAYREPQPEEDTFAYNRRVANAYYYLGLTESNFGNYEKAITFFENANRLELQGKDVVTRLATAEAYVMMDNFDMARQFITDVEEELHEIEMTRPLRTSEVPSRATLIRANMALLERGADWHLEVQLLLEEVVEENPYYYYATATLAQVHHDQGTIGKAQELFHKAYESIEHSGQLLTVTETRSRILLLMVAGMCCKHGLTDERRAEQHLDEADHLRGALPRMGPQVCTVFSTLSKRNESSDTIRHHIELIRKGKVLL
jgi:tetratricopeptide (TPR) repeat protein